MKIVQRIIPAPKRGEYITGIYNGWRDFVSPDAVPYKPKSSPSASEDDDGDDLQGALVVNMTVTVNGKIHKVYSGVITVHPNSALSVYDSSLRRRRLCNYDVELRIPVAIATPAWLLSSLRPWRPRRRGGWPAPRSWPSPCCWRDMVKAVEPDLLKCLPNREYKQIYLAERYSKCYHSTENGAAHRRRALLGGCCARAELLAASRRREDAVGGGPQLQRRVAALAHAALPRRSRRLGGRRAARCAAGCCCSDAVHGGGAR